MTGKALLLVPLDERPINSEYPRLLAAAAGWDARIPTELLGSRKQPADMAGLGRWLADNAGSAGAVGAVIAIDTLAWGGLIPSRQSDNDAEAAMSRLEVLRQLKLDRPELPLLAFSSIQRVSRDNDDGEEPQYYRTHGNAIFRRSQLEHRHFAGRITDSEMQELERLQEEIPQHVWEDQIAIRARTAAVNIQALKLVEEGVIDTLVLNQDDTAVWGVNVMHRQYLEQEARDRRLLDRVFIYPGADEVAQVLIARLAAQVRGRRIRLGSYYASRRGAEVQTAYEDRPLGDLLAVHTRAAGAVLLPSARKPDAWVAINSPSVAQGQGGANFALAEAHRQPGFLTGEERGALQRMEASVGGPDRSLASFADVTGELLKDGDAVTVADVAHVNGADDELMTTLAARNLLPSLSGYGGWNTAGNALGSAVALGCLAALGADKAKLRHATVARFLDDWLYQARVRTRLLADARFKELGLGGFMTDAQLELAARLAMELLDTELHSFGLPYRVTALSFPWRRVFEIDFSIHEVEPGSGDQG